MKWLHSTPGTKPIINAKAPNCIKKDLPCTIKCRTFVEKYYGSTNK